MPLFTPITNAAGLPVEGKDYETLVRDIKAGTNLGILLHVSQKLGDPQAVMQTATRDRLRGSGQNSGHAKWRFATSALTLARSIPQ